jgi:hypothetical protein
MNYYCSFPYSLILVKIIWVLFGGGDDDGWKRLIQNGFSLVVFRKLLL